MPREQINYPDLTHVDRQRRLLEGFHEGKDGPLPTSELGPWNESSIHVGWFGPEASTTEDGLGWVQVGFELDMEYARFAMSSPNGVNKDRTQVWSPTLSPAEVDRMIAMLKRARRKAFTRAV